MTPAIFAEQLLARLALPVTDNNVRALVAFQYQEGGHTNHALYNPLNTMLKTSSSVNFNTGKPGGGVQAYSSWDEGLEATAKTMAQNNMRPIVDSLRASASPVETVAKIGASDWGWWDPKKGRAFLLPHTAADAIVRSSDLFQKYATQAYSGGSGAFTFLSSPFQHMTPKKFGVIAVGVVALAGVALIAWGAHKRRTEGG